jgi:hypothetical protein
LLFQRDIQAFKRKYQCIKRKVKASIEKLPFYPYLSIQIRNVMKSSTYIRTLVFVLGLGLIFYIAKDTKLASSFLGDDGGRAKPVRQYKPSSMETTPAVNRNRMIKETREETNGYIVRVIFNGTVIREEPTTEPSFEGISRTLRNKMYKRGDYRVELVTSSGRLIKETKISKK